jgi:transposase InsO family protein
LLYINKYDNIEDFEKDLKKYILWYNNKRVKLRLKGLSPIQYRAQYYKNLNT